MPERRSLEETEHGIVPAADPMSLTPRELGVLAALAEGLTAASIARKLAIGPRTVHKHLEHIYAKLGVTDRLSAVLGAQRAGLLTDVPSPATQPAPAISESRPGHRQLT